MLTEATFTRLEALRRAAREQTQEATQAVPADPYLSLDAAFAFAEVTTVTAAHCQNLGTAFLGRTISALEMFEDLTNTHIDALPLDIDLQLPAYLLQLLAAHRHWSATGTSPAPEELEQSALVFIVRLNSRLHNAWWAAHSVWYWDRWEPRLPGHEKIDVETLGLVEAVRRFGSLTEDPKILRRFRAAVRVGADHLAELGAHYDPLRLLVEFKQEVAHARHELEQAATPSVRIPAGSPFQVTTQDAEGQQNVVPSLRDEKTEARDRWLYQRCEAGATYRSVSVELARLAARMGWRKISSPQGIEQAVDRYIRRHRLPPLPPRKEG